MPQSPYIDRLKIAIAEASDPTTRGMRRADLAACLARLGDITDAESEIANLRAEFGDGRSGKVSILIMCAEAQVIYYRNLGEQARDRMMRAQLLSVAGRDAGLSALTSAWLAHISFNLHRHDEMARSVKTCLSTITAEDHEAASRLALTLGDAFYAADQVLMGKRWYAKAHEHAVKLGDHAVMGALTYNRAAMGTFMARIKAAEGVVDPAAISLLAGEVQTAINYQAVAQLSSLQGLLDYALASVKILSERFSEAMVPLNQLAETKPSTSPIERSIVLTCDFALCLAEGAQFEEARTAIASVSIDDLCRCTTDDQVVALSALSRASRACGLVEQSTELTSRLRTAIGEHHDQIAALAHLLEPFSHKEAFAQV